MSISSKLSMFKKSLTALVGAALVAGSLVSVTPAVAAGASGKQPAKTVSLGTDFDDNGNGRVVVSGGWVYSLQGFSGYSFWSTASEATGLKRTKVSTIGSASAVTILGQSDSDSSRAVSTVGETVTKIYRPISMDVVGNSAFVLDHIFGNEQKKRLIHIDLSGATDSSANLTGTVIATTDDGLSGSLSGYSNVKAIAAISETKIYIASTTDVFTVDKSEISQAWSSDSGVQFGPTVWGLKVTADGELVVAQTSNYYGGSWTFKFFDTNDWINPSNPTATATIASDNTSTFERREYDFAVDPANNDIVFIQKNGSELQRLVRTGSTYGAPQFEAMGGAEQFTATALAPANPASVGMEYFYEATVTESVAGIGVGAELAFGGYTCPATPSSCYFNSNGSAIVTALSGNKVSIKTTSPLSGQGYSEVKLQLITHLGTVTGVAIDSTMGLVALDRGGNYESQFGARLVTFKNRLAPLGVSSISIQGGHKYASASFRQPGFVKDLVSIETYLFEGATSVAAVAAATDRTTIPAPRCSLNKDGSGNGYLYPNNYSECKILDGLTAGKFYAVAVKSTTVDGTVVWNVSTSGSAVSDSSLSATLPTEPDPADSNVGPGYAHQGATSSAASELISSGFKRLKSSDGKGGNYFAFLTGANFKSTIKVVHILSNGTVDTAFGTQGILEMAAQATGSSSEYDRQVKLGWYGDGKFAYLDRDGSGPEYNLTFTVGSDVQSWGIPETEADRICAQAFPGALSNTARVNEVNLISTPTDVVMVELGCNASYGASANDFSTRVEYSSIPVYAIAVADETLEFVASSVSGVTNHAQAQADTNRCVDPVSSRNSYLPGSGDALFTALIATYAPNGGYCNSYNSTKSVQALQVFADGTTQKVSAGMTSTGSTTIENSWTTSSGKSYLEIINDSDRKLYRFTSAGVLDTTFGTGGSRTISPPACAGQYRFATGISESDNGDVYFNGLSWVNQMGSNAAPVIFPFAMLLEKSSGNTAELGSKYLGASIGFSSYPTLTSQGYWNEFGNVFSTTTMSSNGDTYLAYYAGAAGMKSVRFDSFTSDVPAGDDRIECPPSPFEAVGTPAPFTTEGVATVQMTDGSIFAYNTSSYGTDAGKAAIFTPGSGASLKNGTFAVTERSIDVHGGGWAVALPGNKVLVGGGSNDNMQATRSIEVYDPAAAAGSKWTKLTGTAGATDLLASKRRNGAVAQLLANGKVLVFGGYDMNAYSDGELITIGGANASSSVVAFADAGAPFANIIPAGAGKWLLLGTSDRIMAPTVATSATKIYTESTGALTAGPALSAGRVTPAVVSLGGTKTLIAGDNTMAMGPNSPIGGRNSYDIYDSANNSITSKNLTSTMMNSTFTVVAGALLPSGKVVLVQSNMTMNPAQSKVLNLTTSALSDGELMINGLRNTKLFNIGDKVLLAGGRNPMGGGMNAVPWQVFTEPTQVAAGLSVDARKVLKGTTGSMTITAGVPLVIGSGANVLSVTYSNGTGSVLKVSPSALVSGATKLKLDKTGFKVTVALPSTAQINASAVGTVIATLKQGTTSLGTVTINYVNAKDTPVFEYSVPPTIPGSVASFPIGVTTSAGNGEPTLSYKSGTTKVCTVAATGQVTRVARGLCKITVSQAADLGTLAKSQEYSFTFAKSTAALTFAAGTPAAGNIDLTEDDIQLNIGETLDSTPTTDLALVYSVDNDDKCSIDEEGVLNTLAVGTCLVTVTFAGDANVNGPVSITRQYNIVTPSQENPGTVGGVIGDAVFEAKDDAGDTMLTVSMNTPKHVKRTIKLGRGWKIVYTPTLKKGTTNVVTGANFQPTMTSAYIGTITSTFVVDRTAFAKAPSGWKLVGTTYQCVMTYGSKTQVAANKKIKTVTQKPSKAGCALPALTASVQVKVKNNWTRLAQKKGSAVLLPQKRTAKINLQ